LTAKALPAATTQQNPLNPSRAYRTVPALADADKLAVALTDGFKHTVDGKAGHAWTGIGDDEVKRVTLDRVKEQAVLTLKGAGYQELWLDLKGARISYATSPTDLSMLYVRDFEYRKPVSKWRSLFNNPIAEGELVRIPSLDAVGIVKERIEEGGLLGSATKFRVETEIGGQKKSVIIPSRGVKRLNPNKPFAVTEDDLTNALFNDSRLDARGSGTKAEARLQAKAMIEAPARRRNPARERKPCPSCGQRITIPHTAVELMCPHCDARLGVTGGRR